MDSVLYSAVIPAVLCSAGFQNILHILPFPHSMFTTVLVVQYTRCVHKNSDIYKEHPFKVINGCYKYPPEIFTLNEDAQPSFTQDE